MKKKKNFFYDDPCYRFYEQYPLFIALYKFFLVPFFFFLGLN